MTEPAWLDASEARLWRTWVRLNHELMSALGAQLSRESGLSDADYAVLVPLSESADGVLQARDLREQIFWDRSRLSHQIRRMEERGLLAREPCPDDARSSMVRITSTGLAAITEAAPGHVAATRRHVFDHLNDDDITTLTAIFDRLLTGLDHDTSGPTTVP
ncbi:MAG: MarR family winged helix-turn-helix transcriptional regulator [Actinomycetota bacterium]